MENYIRVYDDVITHVYCDELIKKFEDNKHLHRVQETTTNRDGKTLTHIKLTDSLNETNPFFDDLNPITNILMRGVARYKSDLKISDIHWPAKVGLETIKIKRYMPNSNEEFPPHIDNVKRESCHRYLVMFIYLADNEHGQTLFHNQNVSIPCKKGSMLLFPPYFPWVHSGRPAIKIPKYIVGSYVHVV